MKGTNNELTHTDTCTHLVHNTMLRSIQTCLSHEQR